MSGTIRITIRREDREKGFPLKLQTYEIRTDSEMTVLESLNHIFYRLDATLAYRRYRCGRKLCRSCEIKLDGKVVRGGPLLDEVVELMIPLAQGREQRLERLRDRQRQ